MKLISLCSTIILALYAGHISARQSADESLLSQPDSAIENGVEATISVDGTIGASFHLTPVMQDLASSWALAVAPDNKVWVTHREGNISIISQIEEEAGKPAGKPVYRAQNINFTPDDLLSGGQGGLLDIIFHPNYSENGWIYLSYSAGIASENALKIVRFKVNDSGITQLESVFEVANKKDTPVHYGGRLAFAEDNALLVTTGDGFDYREQAQVKDNQLGKILRMTDSGLPHPQNPFYQEGNSGADYVFSLGHRNPQGLLVTQDQTIIAHEHGPAGGDEINIIDAGNNYGWPVITQGKDYSGATISPFTTYPGMQQPDLDWTPSIAPSGMTYYTHDLIKNLQHYLLITSLKFQQIYAVPFTQNVLGKEVVLLSAPEARLRDIEFDVSGNIWVLGDGEPATLYHLQAN